MSKYIPLDTWIKNNKIRKPDIISFVAGLDSDVKELSNILGSNVILVVREQAKTKKQTTKKYHKLKIN